MDRKELFEKNIENVKRKYAESVHLGRDRLVIVADVRDEKVVILLRDFFKEEQFANHKSDSPDLVATYVFAVQNEASLREALGFAYPNVATVLAGQIPSGQFAVVVLSDGGSLITSLHP